jgi:hypothetical protein
MPPITRWRATKTTKITVMAYRFRYEGLYLVLQSSDKYLFLPAGGTHTNGTAILLPGNESLRLEFSPAGQTPNAAC